MNSDFKKSEIFIILALVFLIALHREIQKTQSSDKPEAPVFKREEIGELPDQRRQHNPPIILLSEQERRFRFDLGSASVPFYFTETLKANIIPLIDSLSQRYECNTIEIVGHTDGVPLRDLESNLDLSLATYFRRGEVEDLTPGSNLDLGMMRALAIVALLQKSQSKGWLQQIDYFFPYSAGQAIGLDKKIISEDSASEDRVRRRIEIRLLRSATRQLGSFN